MTTTWYVCLALAPFAILGGMFWDRIAPYLQRRPAPVRHEGATERFGTELKALKNAPVSPELVRVVPPAEQMVADHEALAEITKALDDFDRNVSNAIIRFLRNQPTVLLRLPSSVEQTGEFSRPELDAMLAAVG